MVVALALVVLSGACGDDGASTGGADDTAPASTTTAPVDAAAVHLSRVLLSGRDLAALGFRPVVVARPFTAQRATRILLCDEDIRTESLSVAGRQSRFTDDAVEVSHTVTSGGDTSAFLGRFRALVERCPGPWTEPALPTGGGPVRREITGAYPLPNVGVDGAGAVIRSRNRVGATDTVVIVLVRGPVVSSLSISGPVGSDFGGVDPAIEAAAERLLPQSPGGP